MVLLKCNSHNSPNTTISKRFLFQTTFVMDFIFWSGLPPLTSSLELKKILISPVKIFEAPPKFLPAQFQY